MFEFKNVSFEYSGNSTRALNDINLEIKDGEFIILAGKSGSGKTTITKCINGLIPHFEEGKRTGHVLLDGTEIANLQMCEISMKVGSVFQDPRSQFFTVNTIDEVAFGLCNLGIERSIIEKKVNDSFSKLFIDHLKNRSVFTLSSGERQKIALASVYAMSPNIFVLDEPSSNLDTASTFHLVEILDFLKKNGKTVIIAEHRLYYLKDLFDKVIYLEDGRITKIYYRGDIERFSPKELESKGLRSFDLNKIKTHPLKQVATRNKDLILSIKDLRFRYSKKAVEILKGINLSVSTGEIIAIIGHNGAGKTTLVKILSGLFKKNLGSVQINGRAIKPKERFKYTYLVMQDADHQLFAESVHKELELGFKVNNEHLKKIDDSLKKLNLFQLKDRHPHSLSGGQKQRLTVAVPIVKRPKIIFLDEPTSGLDSENMRYLTNILKDLSTRGHIIIITTHDYEFIAKTSNRIILLKDGIIKENCPIDNLSDEIKDFFFLK